MIKYMNDAPAWWAHMNIHQARALLHEFGAMYQYRDELVRAAYAAGVPKMEIHKRTHLARSTVDRAIGPE
jgi:hypothetical protein